MALQHTNKINDYFTERSPVYETVKKVQEHTETLKEENQKMLVIEQGMKLHYEAFQQKKALVESIGVERFVDNLMKNLVYQS